MASYWRMWRVWAVGRLWLMDRAILDFLANTGVGGELRDEETRRRDDFPSVLLFVFLFGISYVCRPLTDSRWGSVCAFRQSLNRLQSSNE